MPRKLSTKLRIRAKSGQAFFRASTFAACHPVSRGRGLLNSAAATSCGDQWRDLPGDRRMHSRLLAQANRSWSPRLRFQLRFMISPTSKKFRYARITPAITEGADFCQQSRPLPPTDVVGKESLRGWFRLRLVPRG